VADEEAEVATGRPWGAAERQSLALRPSRPSLCDRSALWGTWAAFQRCGDLDAGLCYLEVCNNIIFGFIQ